MKDLNQNEYLGINGGSFAMDAGWLLGHILNGDFASECGRVRAIMDYCSLYA
ncbi:MAG: hypothetical protein Q8K69_01330 [Bacteroidota bacterium]|nr:hypothetical protein [Bacteroidota bacterium]MDP2112679.1 hypothetical protein [Bacteroidota bacterium]